MSFFGPSSPQPLPGANGVGGTPGLNSAPNVTRANPDRQRRDQGESKQQKKKESNHPHREEDRADISASEERAPHLPVAHVDPPPPEERPHLDIHG